MGLLSWFGFPRKDPALGDYLDAPGQYPAISGPQTNGVAPPSRGRPVNGYADVAPMPPQWGGAAGPAGPQGPARYGNFADYANDTMALRTSPRIETGGPRRGLAPPDAPAGPSMAEQENQAWGEAMLRARAGVQQEGYPYFQSPSVVGAGDSLSAAIEADRLAREEQARRESVSWGEWWRHGGRQAGLTDPNQPAYRFGPTPPARPRR